MTTLDSPNPKPFVYTQKTLERAERSLICSPFHLSLFTAMQTQSISLGAIATETGFQTGYTKRPLSELVCDNALGWLIEVGILRREVDGQGITDGFRLTPLGYQLVEKFLNTTWPSPSLGDRVNDAITRWFRLPF
ncbi:Npun_F0494 family protein [Okeanomitos corallinicola TIOX110]|uniref:Npun_F0494 family protein n=1 Tax=Okeanomitos corallinicola TIOX110 TaxID=3133117 RepID=A0ABZ2UWN2_9CYAN